MSYTRVRDGTARDALRYHAVGLVRAEPPMVGAIRRHQTVGLGISRGVLHLFAGCIRCSAVDVRTTVGLNRLGVVRVQIWMIGVYLAHIKCVCHRRGHHTARSDTPMQVKTTEWFTCMGRSCSLFDERYVLVRCRGHCGSRTPGGAGNTRSFLFFCCFGVRGFAQSSVCVSLTCSVFVGSRWDDRWD